ncbi:MAG: MBL fold metallo-hydrolase [Clostridia bacterium]|nr:MBL fold metallo-hydrolase [Clostridia bacterium]
MTENIEVFKQNHIRIVIGGKVLHVDPFQVENPPHDADVIFITHDHYDHFSVKDVEKVAKNGTVMVVPENMAGKAEAARSLVAQIITVRPGEAYALNGIEFETVPAYNIGKPFHPKSAGWVGYIFKDGDTRIYVAGDTDATEEAANVKCDVALVPVGGTYTMNAKQAAELVNTIKPKVAIPVHYGGIVGSAKDGEKFASMLENVKCEIKIHN